MQFILIAAVAVIAWYGYKSFLKEADRVANRSRRAAREAQNRAAGTLVKDPETGEYRPAED